MGKNRSEQSSGSQATICTPFELQQLTTQFNFTTLEKVIKSTYLVAWLSLYDVESKTTTATSLREHTEPRDEIDCPYCAERILAKAKISKHCGKGVKAGRGMSSCTYHYQ